MQTKKQRSAVKRIIVCAILAAAGFILDRFLGVTFPLFGVKSLSINMSFVPIFFAGFVYGPVWGALVGAVQDLLGAFLVPLGPYFWGYTFTTALVGALAGVFGIIFLKNKLDKENMSRLRRSAKFNVGLIAFCFISTAIASALNSLWLQMLYLPSKAYLTILLPRLAAALLISFPLYSILSWILLTRVTPKIDLY